MLTSFSKKQILYFFILLVVSAMFLMGVRISASMNQGLTLTTTKVFAADPEEGEDKLKCENKNPSAENCGIIKYVQILIRILSGLAGVVIVSMIALGGVQYSLARDNPQATAAAKSRIINALLALVVFMFMFAFLQWLVPGGIV